MRQAHRAALKARRVALNSGGFYVEPRWVVGGLLAVALLSTQMVVGLTGAAAAPTAGSIEASVARFAAAVSSLPIAVADHVTDASIDSSGGEPDSASLELGPMVATSAISAAPSPIAARATARPKATPRPKPTPRPTAVTVKPTVRATATPKPRPTPTPRPTPAIVYRHRATGNATWGHFGGAVITRLPPGTHIRVCGGLGCWEGVSSGYGPSAGGGNLVDLDAAIFGRICGPLGTGVRSIVLSWR